MDSIFKYEIAVSDDPTVLWIPAPGTVLHIAAQSGSVCIWVLVRENSAKYERTFVVHETGHPFHSHRDTYIGTAHVPPYVWHVFERDAARGETEAGS